MPLETSIVDILVPNPAAGANAIFQVPTGLWKVLHITAFLTTSAAAGNRNVGFTVGPYVIALSPVNQAASLGVGNYFWPGSATAAAADGQGRVIVGGPPNIILFNPNPGAFGNDTIQIFVNGILAGDQISGIVIRLQRCF